MLAALVLLPCARTLNAQTRFRPDSVAYDAKGTGSGSVRGVAVTIDRSGNAAVFKVRGVVWSVTCDDNGVGNQRSCSLVQQGRQPALLVWKGEQGAVRVRVGTDLSRRPYIYTNVDLQVDDGPAYSVEEPGWNATQSASIVEALRRGKSVVTSYIEWPSDDTRDATLDLAGFDVAMDYVDFAVQAHKLKKEKSGS